MRVKHLPAIILLLGLIGARGCETPATTQPAPQSLPTIQLTLGNRPFTLETATTDQTREIGLMYRDSMPADHGMIFAFPDELERQFWMKNTRIPLDIVFLDHEGKIVSIKSMKALDLTGIDSDGPAKFAIELDPGAPQDAGLKVGDVIQIPQQLSSEAR
jgi:uncharacterized membrane protein (UPF0127 family)